MGSLCGFTHEVLEFGEDLLNGIEIGAVWREEEELGSLATDCVAARRVGLLEHFSIMLRRTQQRRDSFDIPLVRSA